MLAQGLAGCSGDSSSSSAPSSAPSPVPQQVTQPTPIQLVVFTDPVSGFSTSDVRDVQEEIVQVNTARELIWTANGTRFPGYPVRGNFIAADGTCEFCSFEVRFGTKDGERRAYLTFDYHHDNPGTLVDIEVVGGELVMTRTSVPPPGTYTVSGVVSEATPTGQAPVEGATLHLSSLNQYATTDKNGLYSLVGLGAGISSVWVGKDGYQSHTKDVTINSDTRLDIQIVRR